MTFVDEDVDADDHGGGLIVRMPSGTSQPVMNFRELEYLEDRVAQYHEHNQLTNIADLAELDRLLVMELMAHRIGIWLGQGRDYQGEEINDRQLQDQLNSHSTEIRLVKKTLGLDRPARERAKGEGSTAHYWEQLRVRAMAFGVHRNEQAAKAVELAMQLTSLIQVHDNCADEKERVDLHCTLKDIMQWVRDVFIPEFALLDEEFRRTQQTYWIRSQ